MSTGSIVSSSRHPGSFSKARAIPMHRWLPEPGLRYLVPQGHLVAAR
jgi:hypothetical protein